MSSRARTEREPWRDQFNKIVPKRFDFVEPKRRKMQVTTDRIWNGLGFVVIIKAGKIAPARVAAHFDQAGADHEAKSQPAKKPDDQDRWSAPWKRAAVDQRTKKDREKPGLEQLDFPAVAVPNLTDVHDRHVHGPEHCQQNCIRITGQHNEREHNAGPGEDRQSVVGESKPEEGRNTHHSGAARTKLALDTGEKMSGRG